MEILLYLAVIPKNLVFTHGYIAIHRRNIRKLEKMQSICMSYMHELSNIWF